MVECCIQFYNATIASQKLLDHETRYSMTESKYLAIVWAIYTFSGHLFRQEFILETDHKPLSYSKHSQQKQQQWINVVIFSFTRLSINFLFFLFRVQQTYFLIVILISGKPDLCSLDKVLLLCYSVFS